MVIPPEVLLLLRMVYAILAFVIFHIKLKTFLSVSLKNFVGILMGIALNLKIAFDRMVILTMFILPIHEHGQSLHFLRSSLISLLRDLQFLSYRSFTCLVRVYPRYTICGYCEGNYFPNFFLSLCILCIKDAS